MGYQTRRESMAAASHTSRHQDHRDAATATATAADWTDLHWPFGKIDGLDQDDLRETAYEIFFTACRSSPGFGGRHALTYYQVYPPDGGGGDGQGSPMRQNGVGMAATSRTKRALGLKTMRRSQSRRTNSIGGNPSSPKVYAGASPAIAFTVPPLSRSRRPMTSAEIMRHQMRVTEQSDNRLRKTLLRTLVGQMGRRAETIILPLELLRHLKPSEFNDPHEYHLWQKRQLNVLQAGLIQHPAIPLEKTNAFAARLRDIIRSAETRPIDTSKNSESLRAICNCVITLSWRSHQGASPTQVCHWADGFPLNVHLYTTLLCSIFDLKDESLVLDECDELLELMKKTWSTLGINRSIHNLCFTWMLFQQYVFTGQVESDLLGATLAMMNEVAADAKKTDKDPMYVKMLSSVLSSIKKWSERRLLSYHDTFAKGTNGLMENLLALVFSAVKILEDDKGGVAAAQPVEKGDAKADLAGNGVHRYIQSSLEVAFTKLLENESPDGMTMEVEEATEVLVRLAKETEELALKERSVYSPILKKWHPIPAGVAAVTLHTCYGTLLKQYLNGVSSLTEDTIAVLQSAGRLEKALVQVVVEDSAECEDGGKAIVREMVPYEVDSIISGLFKKWMLGRLKKGKESLRIAKETETWKPLSKTEPYAQSSVDLMNYAKETVEAFLKIPIGVSENLVHNLANGLEQIFRGYTTFVASCGSKQNYMPTLPPLTRCNRGSKLSKMWRKTSCAAGEDPHQNELNEGRHPRPSTTRGTQRLYIRLNTLHYLLSQIHSLDKTLSLSQRVISTPNNNRLKNNFRQIGAAAADSSSFFELALSGIQVATQHVSEVAAYRLIFLDSNSVFYHTLYARSVENSRIRPTLWVLKQNLTLLSAIVTDRAQPLAVKDVMKASFEAFLMVLLAGGYPRVFYRSDYETIAEDFDNLKRLFCTCGEGLISESVVEREAETVEGVVSLMGQSTEQLVEHFSIVACEASAMGMVGAGKKLPMPPTTRRWNQSDPNTVLRVLCHRNDQAANLFLKRTFQLPPRR